MILKKSINHFENLKEIFNALFWVFQNGLINGEKLDGEKRESKSRDGLPPHMSFSRAASYNNPHEMFPSTAKLFSGFNR